jgi:hypothetical protein
MNEMLVPVTVAAAAILITAMLCGAALAAWRGWLEFKRLQLETAPAAAGQFDEEPVEQPSPAVLIEMAAVKERLRRLEAIASGVEL